MTIDERRWTSRTILTAAALLTLFNAPAVRSWARELPPSKGSAVIVAAAEHHHDAAETLGLNAPVKFLRWGWQGISAEQPSPS